jgi:hypothetical protein
MNDEEIRITVRALVNNRNIEVPDDAMVSVEGDEDEFAYVLCWVTNPDSSERTGLWYMLGLKYEKDDGN